jgi:hypothetical protein
VSGRELRFVEQTTPHRRGGLHFETRIYAHGEIPLRPQNWHDLFNAIVWLEHFALKCAMNAAYQREIGAHGAVPRTRAQCALTHFDEAGALVVTDWPALIAAWDAHDWYTLFWRARGDWSARARVILFGHALLEHLLLPRAEPVAKCVVVCAPAAMPSAAVVEHLAEHILAGTVLRDPQELRPLPLAGLPGWHVGNAGETFIREAASFRPLRTGRIYPAPLPVGE